MAHRKLFILALALAAGAHAVPAAAEEQLCDASFQDCRARLIQLIRNETVAIDVAFWFMEDARYSYELIQRYKAGVPVRIIVDPRANSTYPLNADRLAELASAGIPMRRKVSSGILHWKMMLFDGQNTVEFSAANYSPWALAPVDPYVNYTDEAIFFSDQSSIVNSFRTKFDSLWTDTSNYVNYANIDVPLTRRYDTFPKDSELNFPPAESYRSRAVRLYDAETVGIDVTMFRITDRAHTDAIIRARARGIPVRLYTEPQQYRDPTRYWHAWNVDRLYMAGVQIRHRAHAGSNHQKSVTLKGQQVTIFGSSNWTSPSSDSQEEHNYFTTKPWIFQWFSDQFERKWNNLTGHVETEPFVPLPPDEPEYLGPSDLASGVPPTGVTLRWRAGLWAHKYDIYFGTTAAPPLFHADAMLGPSAHSGDVKQFALPPLLEGTTYYWQIVSKTMADQTASGPIYSFTTSGTAAPPPTSGTTGPGDIVLYAGRADVQEGSADVVSDPSAAGGVRLAFSNADAAKVTAPLAAPANYFEMTFDAEPGTPYRLWIRGKAESDYWGNDSVHVQFSGSVNASGAPVWRIGTTNGTEVNLEECSGCGLSSWGWQDNGWGVSALGPEVRFAQAGPQTIRVQVREDGLSIDQILLSPSLYLTQAPGSAKNDTTILPATDGGSPPPPPPDSGGDEVILRAAQASTYAGGWTPVADATAAGGMAMRHPDSAAPKVTTALASPAHYFDLTFTATAGKPYRLWIRGRAERDYWGNDSVHVQFSGSLDASGLPAWRIGTSAATAVNLEDASGAGLSGWGWQDNGYGTGVLGPVVYFETTGTQRIRIQTREDGFSIDQVVLSSGTYVNTAPGALKNDATIVD